MSGIWNWWVFVPAVIICTIAVRVAGEETSGTDVGRPGSRDDAREPSPAVLASLAVGAAIAVGITLTVGAVLVPN